jgi:hypothetical protein
MWTVGVCVPALATLMVVLVSSSSAVAQQVVTVTLGPGRAEASVTLRRRR